MPNSESATGKLRGPGPFAFRDVVAAELDEICKRRKAFGGSTQNLELNLSALCLSGGGVRSASFCLGVMQALASKGLLKKFDYLSTVSGGGFAGAFISRWVHERGYEEVEKELRKETGFGTPGNPLYHLRQYIAYLTPKLGAMSLDSVASAGLYIRNLLVNWLILGPFFFFICALPWLAVASFSWIKSTSGSEIYWPILFTCGLAIMLAVENLRRRPAFSAGSDGNLANDPPYTSLFLGYSLPFALLSLAVAASLFSIAKESYAIFESWKDLIFNSGTNNSSGNRSLNVRNVLVWASIIFIFLGWPLLIGQRQSGKIGEDVSLSVFIWRLFVNWISLAGQFTSFAALLLATWYILAPDPRDISIGRLVAFFPLLFFVSFFLSEVLYNALQGNPPWGEQEREWTARNTAALLAPILVWTVLSSLSLFGYETIKAELAELWPENEAYAAGTLTGMTGLLSLLAINSVKALGAVKKGVETWRELGMRWGLNVLMVIFGFLLLSVTGKLVSGLSIGWNNIAADINGQNELSKITKWAIAALVFGFAVDFFVKLNKFSLHNIYRNRLVRTFVGAANLERVENAANKKPRGFLDFPPSDNILMADLAKAMKGSPPPNLLLVNMAMNVPGISDLALQEQRALPFCASAVAVGSAALRGSLGQEGCFRKTTDYASNGASKITLGTLAAISGAAFDPNMGYRTTFALRSLLTLFNVRLGIWLGNPSQKGKDAYTSDGPVFMILPLILEFLGLANENRAFVHLSDGGHYDNLGVYEILKRRCRLVVIVDAGCDPKRDFEDLGGLQRLAASDADADIVFPASALAAMAKEETCCVLGTVNYRGGGTGPKSGKVIYVKPGLTAETQPLATAYKSQNADFPHETTANQFFSASQFFAYYTLGKQAGQAALKQLPTSHWSKPRGIK